MADDKKQTPKKAPEGTPKAAKGSEGGEPAAPQDPAAEKKSKRQAAAEQKARDREAKRAQKEQGKKKKEVVDDDPLHPKTRKGKKDLIARQKEKEKELVEQGVIPPRNKYKPRGFFWRVLGICLAFFMGIFATVGAAVGAGVILLARPSRDLLSTLGIPLDDVEGLLNDDYLDKSVFAIYDDLMKEVIPNLADPSGLTLGTISKYTPLVDTYINDTLMPNLESLGIHLDLSGENALSDVPLSGLADYAMDTLLPQVKIGPVMGLDKDVSLEKIDKNAPMYALCYGKLGVDYTIKTVTDESGTTAVVSMLEGHKERGITDLIPTLGKGDSGVSPTAAGDDGGDGDQGIMDVLGELELGSFLGLDIKLEGEEDQNNAMLYAMCYGAEGADYEFRSLKDADGADIEGGQVLKMTNGQKKATTVNKLISDSNAFIDELSLGSLLGLESAESLENRGENMMMYTLCYGTENVDWEVKDGKLSMLPGHEPVTIGSLTKNSNDVLNGLPLGEMLGLNTADKVADRSNNAMMYALCYGVEGVDYEIDEAGLIKMKDGVKAVTLGELTSNSSTYIDKMEVDTVLGVTADSDAILRTVAFGNEAKKEDGAYVMDSVDHSKFATEPILSDDGQPTDKVQYLDGGKYYIKEEEGGKKTVVMLPDPNDPTKTYPKKTIGDLTAADANLLDGVTLGSLLNVDSSSSNLMQAMSDWTIDDLKDQNKIEDLKIGDILDMEGQTSGLMRALEDKSLKQLNEQSTIEGLLLGDVLDIKPDETTGGKPANVSVIMWTLREKSIGNLKDQNTVNDLKLKEVLEITSKDSTSGILWAMRDWTLSELGQQTRIERLKIGQLIEPTSGIMLAMEEWRISDLNKQEKIDSLTLGDVIEINDGSNGKAKSPQMLIALKDMSLGEISTGIDTLTLEDVLGKEAFDGGNKILDALKDTQIKDLGAAIDALTVEDVFGDEIWSYAKKSGYTEGQRVDKANKVDSKSITEKYFVGETEVFGAYYTGSDESGWTKYTGNKEIEHGAYYTETTPVINRPTYKIIDYSKPASQWVTFTPTSDTEVLHDEFTDYYCDADHNRHDLDTTDHFFDGDVEVTGKVIPVTSSEGVVTSYNYEKKIPVSYRYAAATGGQTYAKGGSTVVTKYFSSNEEAVRYHTGVWYLLLGEDDTKNPPITEMGELVTGIAGEINTMTLGEMYNHELIENDPAFDLNDIKAMNLTEYDNLSELKISEVIELVKDLAGKISNK